MSSKRLHFEKTEVAHKAKRWVSVSGMLKHLEVSQSGYCPWLKHVLSNMEQCRKAVKNKIRDIYKESKEIYGAPKITKELRKTGECIAEHTVYCRSVHETNGHKSQLGKTVHRYNKRF